MSYQNGLGNRLAPFFAVVTLPLGILAFTFFDLQTALAVFVVGWLLLVPASAVLFGPAWWPEPVETMESDMKSQKIAESPNSAGDDAESDADPIATLRDRYARGEIDELELERRLDALLEIEDLDPIDEEAIERVIDTLDGEDARDVPDLELEPE